MRKVSIVHESARRVVGAVSAGLFVLLQTSIAAVHHVGEGHPYQSFGQAAAQAEPGDTVLLHEGTYPGGEFIADLKGRADAWITIAAAEGENVVITGGTTGWHLSDPAFLHIRSIIFFGQTGNGVNVDDGGSYETPARHIVFEECEFREINAEGNNDLLKLSGLDSFEIRNCRFSDGSPGGSGIDMVGCHYGIIAQNYFERQGSNSIQAKGGTQFIRIERNFFRDGGQRTLNLGGSTGLQFFRPIDAPFEAADLGVYANVFVGSTAPIAYVGCTRVQVVNNTIYLPDKWVARILQETVDPDRFVSCGDNSFVNNIVVIDGGVSTEINIGPNTRPESFLFSNNLWFHRDNSSWNGPDTPVDDAGIIIGSDPEFSDPDNLDFDIDSEGPAVGRGTAVLLPEFDYSGRRYAEKRSIGAFEGNPAGASGFPEVPEAVTEVMLHPNPFHESAEVRFRSAGSGWVRVDLYDQRGRRLQTLFEGRAVDVPATFRLKGDDCGESTGLFFLRCRFDDRTETVPFLYLR